MKARELVDQLQKYDPDEEVIALVWFKDTFDFDNNDDLTLTDEAWLKVVKEMEESGGIDSGEQQISEHISESVVEHSTINIKAEEK
jgi:predicted ATP-dependent Lon-type protease